METLAAVIAIMILCASVCLGSSLILLKVGMLESFQVDYAAGKQMYDVRMLRVTRF